MGMTSVAAARAVESEKTPHASGGFNMPKPNRPFHRERSIRLPSCRYLGESDRVVIADLVREGKSLRHIARTLNCSASTISREVQPIATLAVAAMHRDVGAFT